MFKVTSDRKRRVGVILTLEGRLTAAWVDEFDRAVAGAMSDGSWLILNLDGLSFTDDRGAAVIRGAVNRGARVAGGSEFIRALIEQERAQ